MAQLTTPDTALNAKYNAAKAYFDADCHEKAAKAIKAANRDAIIKSFGTGKNVLADLEVNFSSHTEYRVDNEALEAFLVTHGKSLNDFKAATLGTRLTVKKVA